jgi:transposase
MVTWDSDRFARGLTLGEVRRRLWPLVPTEVRESWKILLVGDEISRTLKKGPGCRIEDEVELELGCRTGEDLEHANCPSPPCGTTRRDRLEARRLRAAELFAAGVHQVEVARQLGVSAQAVSVWHRRWQAGGPEALHSRGPSGPAPRLSDAQLATVEQALLEGATANGFIGELWTLERIATVIKRLTGGPPSSGLGVDAAAPPARLECATPQASCCRTRPGRHRPLGQAALAGDQANAQRRRACLVFFDESALSLTPNVRRTWAPVGQPPTLTHPFNWKKASMAAALCYGVRGGGAQLAFHVTAGNYNTDILIEVLSELRRFLGGEKATLLWDGLPAHRSRAMRAWLATQRSWLVVERLPAYAPELNPVEGLWSSFKAVELGGMVKSCGSGPGHDHAAAS